MLMTMEKILFLHGHRQNSSNMAAFALRWGDAYRGYMNLK